MRNIISAIIIDKEYKSHNISGITYKVNDFSEQKFDVHCVDSPDNILKEFNKFRGFDCLISIGNMDFSELNALSFEFRKKWIHFDEFDEEKIARGIISTFSLNIGRIREQNVKLFSIFTCTFNTGKKKIERLYNSILSQTYPNWNWWILDDSKDSVTVEYIQKLHDPRIHLIQNVSDHGNIGYNKHLIASVCDGDYLVEVDHDDELTPDCLEKLKEAFDKYNDTDFVYSDTLEYVDERNESIFYGDEYGFGQGTYRNEEVNGKLYTVAIPCPCINAKTIRTIYGEPNHVRCWKKEFYHKIGGHNTELSVLDDMDIIIRTFLYGKITKVNKVLYIQHEGERENVNSDNAQNKRFKEIQRTVWLLKNKYDKQIHERILSLGYKDDIWVEEQEYSELRINTDNLPRFDYEIQ